MKWPFVFINPILLFIVTTVMINNYGHYVDGAAYQTDQSAKGIDNNDNSGTANYRFEYGVDDGSAGQQFGHEEERNGYLTRGRYTVLLPDGRLQVVTYRADQNGYKADVKYENSSGGGAGSGGGYSNAAGNTSGKGGYGYENVETSASSYGPPAPQAQQNYRKENSGSSGFEGGSKSSKNGNSRNFVKLRRTVDGRMFNYAY